MKFENRAWYFTILVAVIYAVTYFLAPEKVLPSLESARGIFIKIIPIFALIFILMALTNYFIEPKKLAGWLNKKHGWLVAVAAGILSSGPIYMWYPLLQDLQKHKVRNGLIAAFLYNRAIKIPLLPMLILYFSLSFAVVLTLVMAVLSILQGLIVEKLVD